jgi:regulator of PEP synthase PpsR (kinase-PPPase family)
MKRSVFFISDGTGITVENLGQSLLTQFEGLEFEKITLPYINTPQKGMEALERINAVAAQASQPPIVFSTLVNMEISGIVATCNGLFLDFFKTFLVPLEKELQTKSSHHVGRMHSMANYDTYMSRINAVNYTLSHDDGVSTKHYDEADIIIIGVSRCGKTPTCLYLALQFGIFAANYPFTEEDISHLELPPSLAAHREKLFGLTIEGQRLQAIRHERRPNSRYASLAQCQLEIKQVEKLFQTEKIPYLNSTFHSIEEIATTVLAMRGIKRRLN